MIRRIIGLCLILIFLSGCNEPGRQLMLIVDPGGIPITGKPKQAINRVFYAAKPDRLWIGVENQYPGLLWLDTKRHDCATLDTELEAQRREQRERELPLPAVGRLQGADKKKAEKYGWGSPIAPVLRMLIERRTNQPVVIVVITDGFNEGNSRQDLESALKAFFAKGPTKMIVLGLSQKIDPNRRQDTILELWRKALINAGAKDINLSPESRQGFIVSSSCQLPIDWLE